MNMKAVIPAAGLGTRFLPATKAQPKEMLPVVDRPVIHYVVQEAVDAGINDILIVTGRGKRAIEDYFDKSYELEHELAERGETERVSELRRISDLAHIHYIRQKEPRGLGDAIYCARKYIGDEPFAVLLGDIIIKAPSPCARQLIDVFEKYQSPILGIERVDMEHVHKYGIVGGTQVAENIYLVKDLIEKPAKEEAPSNLAILGRYILTPDIFNCIEHTLPGAGGEIQLTDAIGLLRKKRDIYATLISGKRYDIGHRLGWLEANILFALDEIDLEDELKQFMRDLL